MPLRRLIGFLAILAAAVPPALAETYKWVDEKGVVNYSNKPPPALAAGRQVVEERLSVVATDPSIGPAVAAMNARAARRTEFEEADWARRQGFLLATYSGYASAGPDCPYRADCSTVYDMPAYYYPYAYGGAVFYGGGARRFPHAAHHQRPQVTHRGRGAMHAGRGSLR